MEINTKEFKESMTDTFEKFKRLETEILAYSLTIRIMEETGRIKPGLPWNEMQVVSRQNPLIVKMLSEKYDYLIAGLMQAIDQSDSSQALADFLGKWKPSDPIN